MECQRCHKRKATVHLTDIGEENEKRSVHLCERCANDEQDSGMELVSLLSGAFPEGKGATSPPELTCTACGLGYLEFRGRGRLGCPECYEKFSESLDPLLEKIHGKPRHVGKAPGEGSAEDRSRERRLVALRRKLHEAVKQEDYEDAARLRDELRDHEAGGEPDEDH